jgi:hypothetical protein
MDNQTGALWNITLRLNLLVRSYKSMQGWLHFTVLNFAVNPHIDLEQKLGSSTLLVNFVRKFDVQ